MLLSFRDVVLESLVELLEVSDEIPSLSRCDVTFRVNCNGRVVAFVGVEWEDSSHSMWSVVVGKFCEGTERAPVILLIVTVSLKELF